MIVSIRLSPTFEFQQGNIYAFRNTLVLDEPSYDLQFIGTSRADGEYLFAVIKMGYGNLKDCEYRQSSYGSYAVVSSKEVITAPDDSMIVEEALKNYDFNASKIISFMVGYMNIPVDAMYSPGAYKSIIRDIKLKIMLDGQ